MSKMKCVPHKSSSSTSSSCNDLKHFPIFKECRRMKQNFAFCWASVLNPSLPFKHSSPSIMSLVCRWDVHQQMSQDINDVHVTDESSRQMSNPPGLPAVGRRAGGGPSAQKKKKKTCKIRGSGNDFPSGISY